ncbi:hypothetical protein [Amycolatopsis saalfeldensis]|uniref:Uncharacterized protein n=1 Tax=Amycolatopsis saalfeldensis TaxID=394193 RepID=A0A1H8YJU2_9PSEU|nr:hypothetical protein [Amycolatopsis saalfeldensis]SEP52430.1 hypothetical protein SAMN04489732_12093 [Amycolatopsis saalfeldensis]
MRGTVESLLHRIYRLRLTIAAIVFTALGTVLLIVSHSDKLDNIALALLGLGVVSIVFEYGNRSVAAEQHREALDEQRQAFEHSLREFTTELRDSVLEGLAADDPAVFRHVTDDAFDRITQYRLTRRLGNADLARDIVRDLSDQVTHSQGRLRYDQHISITITPWTPHDIDDAESLSLYMASVRCSHRTEAPLGELERQYFRAVASPEDYAARLRDPNTVTGRIFPPNGPLAAASPDVFTLLRYDINGVPQAITDTTASGERVFTVTPTTTVEPGKLYTVDYEYQALIDRDDHGMRLDITAITHRLAVDFTTYDSAIRHVEPVIAVPGYQPTRVHHTRTGHDITTITSTVEGWIRPVTTISFIWTRDTRADR